MDDYETPKRSRRGLHIPWWEIQRVFLIAFLLGGIATAILVDMWLANH